MSTTGPDGSAERMSRVLAQLTSASGALLIWAATVTTTACIALGILVVRLRDGFGSWIPLIIGLAAAGIVIALAWDRRRLATELRQSKETTIVSGDTGGIVPRDANESELAALQERARLQSARTEYHLRRDTPLPRVEAAQRAAKEYLGGTVHSPWLARDLRWTLGLFIASAAAIPITTTTAIIATIVALTS